MAAPHNDQQFGHGVHIAAIILTLGAWFPVWLARWTMHKVDRTREAVYDLEQKVERIDR